MAQNPFLPIKFIPQGGMSSDSDERFRHSGMYGTDTKNIQFLTSGGATTPSIEPTIGNTYAYTLPSVVAQNKIFRVYMDAINGTDTYTLTMSNGNSVVIGVATWNGILNDPLTMANNAIAAILAAVNPVAIAWGIPVQTSTTAGYFDFQFFGGTAVDYWDYSISLTSTNATPTLPIVIQEAIDASLVGDMVQIGSYDLAGDLFLWSTTQHELPSELSITNISNNGAGVIRVTVPNHGLVTGERVVIKGSIASANGQWIVNVIDANNFDLQGSAFVANATTGIVVINPSGIGEVGVAQRDDNSQTWTYTTLLRTKEWNFVTKHQPKTYCERNDILASLYWTDNYNVPRVMYYAGAYMTNGALTVVNVLGEYEYGVISLETKLVRSYSSAHLGSLNQLQGSGNVPPGNHRYAIRFLTENLSPTLLTDPTPLINVFTPIAINTPANAILLQGDEASILSTGKINQFTITGITPNLYKYVELINIRYSGNTPVATIVRRDLLTQQTTQLIEHTGFEAETQVFDISFFSQILGDIFTALNIGSVSNRLVLSNTGTSASVDFSEWTKTWKHNVKRAIIDTVGSRFSFGGPTLPLSVNEFQLPNNVFENSGLMLQETYCWAAKLRLKTGGITESFWIDYIKIDNLPTNTANPTDNRRVSGLPDLNLTDIDGNHCYSPFIEFTDIRWDFVIDGILVKDIVDEIIFERVDMSPPLIEIKGSGVSVMGFSWETNSYTPAQPNGSAQTGYYYRATNDQTPSEIKGYQVRETWMHYMSPEGQFVPNNVGNRRDIGDYPFACGVNFTLPPWVDSYQNPLYTDARWVNNINRNYSSFYCPDMLFGEFDDTILPSDFLLIYGSPQPIGRFSVGYTGANNAYSAFFSNTNENTGYTNVIAPTSYQVGESHTVGRGANVSFATGVWYSKRPFVRIISTENPVNVSYTVYDINYDNPGTPVLYTNAQVTSPSAFPDFGIYQSQIYSPKPNKFLPVNKLKYVPTGIYLQYSGINIDSKEVREGDVFTQKTWFQHYRTRDMNLVDNVNSNMWSLSGFGQGMAIYSQNRINSQMISRTASSNAWKYPRTDESTWLYNSVSGGIPLYSSEPTPILSYNNSYNNQSNVVYDNAFDPNIKRSNKQPARFWWSDIKPENSIVDNYTNFPPFNFKDLQLSFGPIQEHKNVNSQLMSWQNNHYELQYFDSTGLLVTNSLEAVLGNAGVMAQRGNALSTYGTSHGFSVIKGKTGSGKDTVAWIDTVHGKIVKHDPSQGTSVISDVEQMRWFANNYTRYAGLYDTPADGAGIHGVFDHQNNEFIWTVRAKKTGVQQWVNVNNYNQGDVVEATAIDFHLLQTFYRCLITNQGLDPSTNPTHWEAIPFTEYEYYNVFTLAYNEVKNKFTTFYSYLPKIYSTRGKLFLSPSPVNDERQAYEHLRGDYCTWYTQGNLELTDRWRIGGMSINHDINLSKHFLNIMFQSKLAPTRIEVKTSEYSTYMQDIDCEKRFDQWVVSIKNNLDAQGRPDQDTSFLLDTWASVSIEGLPKVYTNFFDFIMRARYISRTYQT